MSNATKLNSMYSDQIDHCVNIPHISRPTKASAYSTKFAMVQCRTSFTGSDTVNVTTHSDFSMTSELLSLYKDASIIGRPDIRMLLKQKVEAKQISPLLADSFENNAKRRYTEEKLYKYAQGSTYVSFSDMIKIQLHLVVKKRYKLLKTILNVKNLYKFILKGHGIP